jgi:hypothetical protein
MRILPIALVAALAVAAPAAAQENYEIQVYPSKTADPKTTLFELHSNWTGSGSLRTPGGVLGTNHALHETLEITHGFSDIFEVGVYLFTAQPTSGGFQYVGAHIRPRIRAPESWKLPVGLSLSTELGPTDGKFDVNTFGMELRPIIDQEIGNFYWAFNPTIGWALEGADAGRGIHGMTFNPNVKLSWKLHEKYAAIRRAAAHRLPDDGLLPRAGLGAQRGLWREHRRPRRPEHPQGHRRPAVRLLGAHGRSGCPYFAKIPGSRDTGRA